MLHCKGLLRCALLVKNLHFLVVIEVIEVSASLEVIDVCHADN